MAKPIIKVNNNVARSYFMNPYIYFPCNLPKYFTFDNVLAEADQILTCKDGHSRKDIHDVEKSKGELQRSNHVNYIFNISKANKDSWRTITLLNPIIYVDLVNTITQKDNWNEICTRFNYYFPPIKSISKLKSNYKNYRDEAKDIKKHFKCVSIPLISNTINKGSIKSNSIINWRNNFEYKSIDMSLKYSYCEYTDISNCYESIYTHSISWALTGENNAKKHRKYSYSLGNLLDKKIRDAQYGETNGIPQSNSLCDLVAEMVLGYVDRKLYESIDKNIDYFVLRFRDDYRIFSDSQLHVKMILEKLSSVLSKLHMNLNPNKTHVVKDLVSDVLKPDKLYLITKGNPVKKLGIKDGLIKKLIFIESLSTQFTNSGCLSTILSELYKKLLTIDNLDSITIKTSISIVTAILIQSPRVSTVCIAIINKLLLLVKDNHQESKFINYILNKMKKVSHTSLEEIWLQQISMCIGKEVSYDCKLCKKVNDVYKKVKPIYNNFKTFQKKIDEYINKKENMGKWLSLAGAHIEQSHLLSDLYNTHKEFWHDKNICNIWNNNWLSKKYSDNFQEDIIDISVLYKLNRYIDPKDINPFNMY